MKRSTLMWASIGLVYWIKLGFYTHSLIKINPKYGWIEDEFWFIGYQSCSAFLILIYILFSFIKLGNKFSIVFWIKKLNDLIDKEPNN